jgi:hypothetical protein
MWSCVRACLQSTSLSRASGPRARQLIQRLRATMRKKRGPALHRPSSVNQEVAGSSPARGATYYRHFRPFHHARPPLVPLSGSSDSPVCGSFALGFRSSALTHRVLEIVVSIAEQLDVPAARLAPAREISARTTTLGSVGSSRGWRRMANDRRDLTDCPSRQGVLPTEDRHLEA